MWDSMIEMMELVMQHIVEIAILCFEFIGVIVIIISGAKGFWNYVRREPEMKITLAQGLAQGSGNLMLRAIVADVADKHRLDSGEDRAGLFFSVFSLAGKTATAVAVGIALPLIGWIGFDPRGGNDAAALDGLLLVFALGPALAHALSAALIARFPLDEAAHSEIRRRLDVTDPRHAFAE